MESGFIYLWYDRKHKRFYLGKHWGPEDDGYVCSSTWMKRAYNRRPQDFGKRKILQRITTTRQDLAEAEYRWGFLIKKEELGKRYYNLEFPGKKQWHDDPESRKTVGQKISDSHRNMSPEKKKLFREKCKHKTTKACHVTPHSEATKERIRQKLKGRPLPEETRRKMSESRQGKKRGPYKRRQ